MKQWAHEERTLVGASSTLAEGLNRQESSTPVALAASAAPVKAWTRLFGTNETDVATALATGTDGSIYVVGYTYGSLGGQTNAGKVDAFVTRYTPDGITVWTRLLGSTSEDYAQSVATGLDGSVYVSCYTRGSLDGQSNAGANDIFLTKFSADGTKAWTQQLGSRANEEAYALTTGLDGSIYVGGTTEAWLDGQQTSGSWDALLTKYTPDGTKTWTRMLGSSLADYAYALTTGLDGSIYIAGKAQASIDNQPHIGNGDVFVTKYDVNGTRAWTRMLGSSGADYAFALTTGLDGCIYVGGRIAGAVDGQTYAGGNWDAFLTKYAPDGTKAWTKLLGSTDWDGINALTTGIDGSIYASGFTWGSLDGQTSAGGRDVFLAKYDSDGTEIGTVVFGSSRNDEAYALTTGTDGSIYVSGSAGDSLDGQHYANSGDIFLTRFLASALLPLLGTPSDDTLTPRASSESIDGGAGLDTLVYAGTKATYQLSQSATNFVVINPNDSDTDTLSNIERLKFADTNVALDMASTQSGGQTALLIGAVLGKGTLMAKKPLVGAVLDLFDQGYTLEQLCGAVMRLPIWSALTNGGQAEASATEIATYLLTTAKGYAPDPATLASAVNSLASDPQGTLLWQLAESSANQLQVGLVGLMTTGLEYAV